MGTRSDKAIIDSNGMNRLFEQQTFTDAKFHRAFRDVHNGFGCFVSVVFLSGEFNADSNVRFHLIHHRKSDSAGMSISVVSFFLNISIIKNDDFARIMANYLVFR